MNDAAARRPAGLLGLIHTAGVAQAYVEVRLASVGLSLAKLAALRELAAAGDSLPLGHLAERLACVKSNITQLVDRLEADGLVARRPDARDRRARLAELTAAGRKTAREGMRIYEEAERELFAPLSADEVRQLTALMGRLAPSRE